jgi:hypothetical protein
MKMQKQRGCLIAFILFIVVLALGKVYFPYLVWLPTMNISQTLFGWWPASWEEEVVLHDGRKIIVKRSQTRGGRSAIGQDVPVNKHTLSFKHPDSGERITWQTTIGGDIKDTELLPLALDIVNRVPYLVTDPMGCIAYSKWKCPNPPYVFLKYDGKEWSRVPLEEFPPEIKGANMVVGGLTLQEEKKLTGRFQPVPANEIKEMNGESKNPRVQYLFVFVREPFDKKKIRCVEHVRAGGHTWISIDLFSNQPNFEACLKICERENVNPKECPCDRFFKGDK